MDELKPERETRTTIIEKIAEDVIFDEEVTTADLSDTEKKEKAKKILFENNSVEKYMENLRKNSAISSSATATTAPSYKFKLEAEKTFFNEAPDKTVELNTKPKVEVEGYTPAQPLKEKMTEIVPNLELEEKVKSEIEEEIEEKDEKLEICEKVIEEEIIKENQKDAQKKLKPNFKTRLKIIVFGFCAVLTCFMGWSIYNAIQIETLTAQLEAANKTYAVNVVSYINNLSKADDLTSDSIFNLEELSTAEVIPLTPKTLENPVEYSIKSNWFDRFCNWLSGIFK